MELSSTAWDLESLADNIWNDYNDELRQEIRRQSEEKKAETRGCLWNPAWGAEISKDGILFPPFKWDGNRRARHRAELDAYFAKMFGLTRHELLYILDPQDVYESDFPGETFRVLKEKEERQFGEYRTSRLILEAWDKVNNIKSK